MVETEVKIPFAGDPQQARALIERHGYTVSEPRTLESDQLFDHPGAELKAADQLLRLRRSGARSTVTYKGPAARERYKSREEIEFDVSDASNFELVLNRLGYTPGFRYEKYRTKFAGTPEPGIITIDETPIGVYLEIEGPKRWIDQVARALGYTTREYITASYGRLYLGWCEAHGRDPGDMVFRNARPPLDTKKTTR